MRSDDEIRRDAAVCALAGPRSAAGKLAADVPEALADRERYRGMLADIEAENARLLAAPRVETFIAMQVDRDNERVKRERAEDLVAEFRKRDEAASKTIARLHDLQERLVTRELLDAVVAERDEARAALAAVRERVANAPDVVLRTEIRVALGMARAAAGVPEPPQEQQR